MRGLYHARAVGRCRLCTATTHCDWGETEFLALKCWHSNIKSLQIMMYRPWHLVIAREERVEEQGSVFSSCPLGWSFSSQFLTAISRDITLNSHRFCRTFCFRLISNQVTLFTSSNSSSGNFRGTLRSNSKQHLLEFGPACGKSPLEKHSSYCTDTAAVFPNETVFHLFQCWFKSKQFGPWLALYFFCQISFLCNNDNNVSETRRY